MRLNHFATKAVASIKAKKQHQHTKQILRSNHRVKLWLKNLEHIRLIRKLGKIKRQNSLEFFNYKKKFVERTHLLVDQTCFTGELALMGLKSLTMSS